jgi:hypothetical protein
MDYLTAPEAHELDKLFKEQIGLKTAINYLEQFPQHRHEQDELSSKLKKISKQIAATKIPLELRTIIMQPAAYKEYVRELETLSLCCPNCVNLDRDPGKLRRMEYFCTGRQKPCITIIEDSGVCLEHKQIDISQASSIGETIEMQLEIARDISKPKDNDNNK